jgi:CubicO group peptidase (beta-lactamase class C family)
MEDAMTWISSRCGYFGGMKAFRGFLAVLLFALGAPLWAGMPSTLEGYWEGFMGQGQEHFRIAIALLPSRCTYNQIDDGLYNAAMTIVSLNPVAFQGQTDHGGILQLQLDPSQKELRGTFLQTEYPNEIESLVRNGQSYPVTLRHGKDFFFPRLSNGQQVMKYSYSPPQTLPDGWPVGDLRQEPYKSRINLASLESGISKILVGKTFPYIHSVVVVQQGKLLMDEYFYGYSAREPHPVHSMTKSVFSILTGLAIDGGRLTLDDSIYRFFGKYDNDPRKDKITVRMLLTMSSGLDCDDWAPVATPPPTPCSWGMVASPDWLDFSLNHSVAYDPGTTFQYCGACLTPLSAMLEKKVGAAIPDFAQKNLFDPLGISGASWWAGPAPSSELPDGLVTPPAFGLYMTARDMAKLGQLFLQQGQWKGQTVISPGWVKDSTTPWIASHTNGDTKDYGYLWWTKEFVYPAGNQTRTVRAFYALGSGRQYLFVVPDLQLVCVLNAGLEQEEDMPPGSFSPQTFFKQYLLPAFGNPGP